MKRHILIHYGEIGLKGSNRGYFVDRLKKQIRDRLQKEFKESFSVVEVLKRIVVSLPEYFDEDRCISILNAISGISNFQFVYEGALDIAEIGQQIWDNMPDVLLDDVANFCVRVKRSMPMDSTSIESEREIGAILLRNGIDKKVKVKNPDLEINIEFFSGRGYFSYKKYKGAGGLSPGTGGKLICLMSSGIDSPVAAYRMMRRGARVVFAHFHSYPFSDKHEMEQVKDLVEILSKYQFDTKLYLLPFGEVQKSIATNLDVPGKLRVVMYRRMMMRIAERISKNEKAKGLITGDSFGQVASQTVENMFAIHEATSIPIYQPLIALDKEEIVEISRKIETFDISKLPCKDTCSMFTPENPETKAKLYQVLESEKDFPIDDWIDDVLSKAEVIYFNKF